ncbi:MAG: hypothetical protein ACI9OS_002002, partial [Ulvibacter sp.]
LLFMHAVANSSNLKAYFIQNIFDAFCDPIQFLMEKRFVSWFQT